MKLGLNLFDKAIEDDSIAIALNPKNTLAYFQKQ